MATAFGVARMHVRAPIATRVHVNIQVVSTLQANRVISIGSRYCFRREPALRVAATAAGAAGASVVDRLKDDTKVAMKARDQVKLGSLRFLSSTIKNREIELRTDGKELTERDALEVVQKLIKQSKQVIEDFNAAGRPEAGQEEQAKVLVWEQYLPTALSQAELEALVDGAIAQLGATSVKQMGQVMKAVIDAAENRADNKQISEMVKARLSAK